MTRAAFLLGIISMQAVWATEPLVGIWKLESQKMNGEKSDFEPLTLRIAQSGDKLAFAFSVPVNNIHYVSMRYVVKLDGSDGEVKNGQGENIGAIKMTKGAASEYKFILSGKNRPSTSGTLTVSSDGNHLTSESGKLKQVFARP
jgi:hypothetical protein